MQTKKMHADHRQREVTPEEEVPALPDQLDHGVSA